MISEFLSDSPLSPLVYRWSILEAVDAATYSSLTWSRRRLIPAIRKIPDPPLEERFQLSCAMHHRDNPERSCVPTIGNHVRVDGVEPVTLVCKIFSKMADSRHPRQAGEYVLYLRQDLIGPVNAVFGDVLPDLDEIAARFSGEPKTAPGHFPMRLRPALSCLISSNTESPSTSSPRSDSSMPRRTFAFSSS